MILDILSRGEMTFAATELIGDKGQLIHLPRSQNTAGHFGPDHLHARLALAVDTAAQTLGAELIVSYLASCELLSVGAELFNIRADGGVVLRFGLELEVLNLDGVFSRGHILVSL